MFELIPFNAKKNNSVDNYFDQIEKAFFAPFASDRAITQFRTDIIDNGSSYTLEAELPGFEKKDIGLKIEDGVLTITASHEENSESKKRDFVRRERRLENVITLRNAQCLRRIFLDGGVYVVHELGVKGIGERNRP